MPEETKPSVHVALDDAALIRAFQAGDENGFNELVLRHKDRLFTLCLRFLGDPQEANDSAQEIFLKVYRSLNRFRFESSFSTWLYRIAVNTCKNRLKSLDYRFKKRMKQHGSLGALTSNDPLSEIPDGSGSPLMQLEQKERALLVQRAIAALPKAKKTVLILRDIEGLSYGDISKITGYTLGTVKSKLARARSDLREKLRGII